MVILNIDVIPIFSKYIFSTQKKNRDLILNKPV